jgi:uncharacterized membrane protein YqjE
MKASVGALRRLAASALALGRIRAELLAIEVQEEKQRLAALLFWAVLAALAVGFALVFLAVTATVWWWDSHRLVVLGLASLGFVGLAAIGLVRLRALTAQSSTLFSSSLAELRADEAALRQRPEPAAAPGPATPSASTGVAPSP